tara:strand:+ start:4935 stop:6050 length:1116 start_codon:yes stop_codon:yes gene_type:complete
MERNWNNVDPDGITDWNSGISGIVYPIPEPQIDDVFGGLVYPCDGFPEECPYREQFWRQDGVPGTLVPPNWIAHSDFVNPGDDDYLYYCPACKLQNDRSVDLLETAGQMEDAEDIKLVHRGQNSNEGGTGRAIHGNQQPPQESHVEYMNRVNNEMLRDLRRQREDFRRQQGRRTNIVERDAIYEAIGIDKFYEDMNQDKMRIIEILRNLNIPFPPQNQQHLSDYIGTLINLIPEDYPKNKLEQEPTKEDLKEEAKKLYGKKPELLRLALEQIDKDEERRRREFHDEVLNSNKNKKRNSDDKGDDGAGSSSSRKKSKKTTEFKGPKGKFSLGKKTKKKGGRRKKRTRRRKSRRKKKTKKRGRKKKKKTKRRR